MSVDDRMRAAARELNASAEHIELVERLGRFPGRRRQQVHRRVAAAFSALLLFAAAFALGLQPGRRTSEPPVTQPPVTTPPSASAVGNLLGNWSFEQDLSGWRQVGPANVTRELGGRTSGSCAFVQATTSAPARVGIVAQSVVPQARAGAAYEATAWVRSGTAGVRVVLTLVVTHGGKREASKTVTRTVSDPRWQRLDVGHRVTTSGELSVEVAVEGVSQGQGLLVDEVVVRQS